jgi:hypothetical protein
MKKIHLLIIFSLFISFCSSNDPVTTEIQNEEADTVITFTKGLTKSSSEYVSNWNKLISEISNDEETLLYFSINPDNVRWTSPERTALFYQFGNSENTSSSFVINLLIQDDRVYGVEFFSPVVNDDISSQRTKLFFLVLIAMADDTLDKEGRESVLSKLGLYDNVSQPNQIGGSLTQNSIQYVIEPMVDNGLLVGLNFYTTFISN